MDEQTWSSSEIMSEASLVDSLPEVVWELITDALLHHARGNPGDVFRLSLVSVSGCRSWLCDKRFMPSIKHFGLQANHALRHLISHLEIWRLFSEQLGW